MDHYGTRLPSRYHNKLRPIKTFHLVIADSRSFSNNDHSPFSARVHNFVAIEPFRSHALEERDVKIFCGIIARSPLRRCWRQSHRAIRCPYIYFADSQSASSHKTRPPIDTAHFSHKIVHCFVFQNPKLQIGRTQLHIYFVLFFTENMPRLTMRSRKQPVIMSYHDEIKDKEVLRVVQQIRKRAGLPDLMPKLTSSTVDSDEAESSTETRIVRDSDIHGLYSSEGEPVSSYRVEVQTDAPMLFHSRQYNEKSASHPVFRDGFLEAFDYVDYPLEIEEKRKPLMHLLKYRNNENETYQQQRQRKVPTVDTSSADAIEDFDSPTRHIYGSETVSTGSPSPRTPHSAQFFSAMCTPGLAFAPETTTSMLQVKALLQNMTGDTAWYSTSPGHGDALSSGLGSTFDPFQGDGDDFTVQDDGTLEGESVMEGFHYESPVGLEATTPQAAQSNFAEKALPSTDVDTPDDNSSYQSSVQGDRGVRDGRSFLNSVFDQIWGKEEELDDNNDDECTLLSENESMAERILTPRVVRLFETPIAFTHVKCGGNLDGITETLAAWDERDTMSESFLDETAASSFSDTSRGASF